MSEEPDKDENKDWLLPTVGRTSGGGTILRTGFPNCEGMMLPDWATRDLIEMLAASQGWTVVITDPLSIPPEPSPTPIDEMSQDALAAVAP